MSGGPLKAPDYLASPQLLTHAQLIRELEGLRDRIPDGLPRGAETAQVPRDVVVACSAAVGTALWLCDRLAAGNGGNR